MLSADGMILYVKRYHIQKKLELFFVSMINKCSKVDKYKSTHENQLYFCTSAKTI